ncbi:10345_t:CDS:2, partial [Dentiscutata heterogama]
LGYQFYGYPDGLDKTQIQNISNLVKTELTPIEINFTQEENTNEPIPMETNPIQIGLPISNSNNLGKGKDRLVPMEILPSHINSIKKSSNGYTKNGKIDLSCKRSYMNKIL